VGCSEMVERNVPSLGSVWNRVAKRSEWSCHVVLKRVSAVGQEKGHHILLLCQSRGHHDGP